MMNRGFFSGFVAIMGVLLLIALFYSQSTRDDAVSQTDELMIGHSLLNRDWALARNAYSQFASDAMAQQIVDSGSCNIPSSFLSDPQSKITVYWDSVHNHLLSAYGVDCTATLSEELYNDLEDPDIATIDVVDNQPAYALLTCRRKINGSMTTLQHPFTLRKDVQVSSVLPSGCNVKVYDEVGSSPGVLDVDVEFS